MPFEELHQVGGDRRASEHVECQVVIVVAKGILYLNLRHQIDNRSTTDNDYHAESDPPSQPCRILRLIHIRFGSYGLDPYHLDAHQSEED